MPWLLSDLSKRTGSGSGWLGVPITMNIYSLCRELLKHKLVQGNTLFSCGGPNLMSALYSRVILQQYLYCSMKERGGLKALSKYLKYITFFFNVVTSSQGGGEALITYVWTSVGRKTPNDPCLDLGGDSLTLVGVFFTFSLM